MKLIRETKIKTTVRYHLVGITSHQSEWPSESLQIINAEESVERKGTFLHSLWKCKLVQPLKTTVWRFLIKLKLELPYDLALSLLSTYLEKPII